MTGPTLALFARVAPSATAPAPLPALHLPPAPAAPPPTPRQPRWYVRCPRCLTVAAVDGARPGPVACPCGGTVEPMGRVERDRLHVGTRHQSPCDSRCTEARGPKCDCGCGGVNHGSGLVVAVELYDGIPRLSLPDPATARRRAEEWQTAVAAARSAIDAAHPVGARAAADRAAGAWVGEYEYSELCRRARALDRLHHARDLRTHHGRMRALADLAREMGNR